MPMPTRQQIFFTALLFVPFIGGVGAAEPVNAKQPAHVAQVEAGVSVELADATCDVPAVDATRSNELHAATFASAERADGSTRVVALARFSLY